MADDHSNPPSLSYVRLGPKATVHEMASAAASRCSGISQRAQFDITVRAVGDDILDDLPAFCRAADGLLLPLTPDHQYWSQLAAYLAGNTTVTEVHPRRSWLDDHPTSHQIKVAINRDWIGQVIIQKTDYAANLRSRNEPLPEWWFTSTEVADAETSDSPLIGWEGFDRASDTYPRELDIAMRGWLAVTKSRDTNTNRTAKEKIECWLETRYPDRRKLSNEARQRIAVVCNWEKSGGRPRRDEK